MNKVAPKSLSHESAISHVTGAAVFIDDIAEPSGMLYGQVVFSPVAKGRIIDLDISKAILLPGVHKIIVAADIPGINQMGPVIHDEPCLASGSLECIGQAICLIAAVSPEIAREAAKRIVVNIETEEPILDIKTAIEKGSFFGPERKIARGNAETSLAASTFFIEGELETGAQEHWYLETHACLCIPGEDREMVVYSSSQHPSETQAIVAEVLGIGRNKVTVEVKRMGGAFGGKETQANHLAAWTSLLAEATNKPVKIRFTRDEDQRYTGKRHPFLGKYKAGYDENGLITALSVQLYSNGGYATDLSWAILERALFHIDNAYFIPDLLVTGQVCKTNQPSNTAFRGFGGPQGMAITEHVLDSIARKLHLDPAIVRYRNFYTSGSSAFTHYGKEVENNRLQMMYDRIVVSSDYFNRRKEIESFNQAHKYKKRGIALTPVKFGISFTTSFLNQAGALVNIYQDGTVNINHGGTEMGQGLHTKIRQIAAFELGISPEFIRIEATNTGKVPNTSATAASSGSDLNGMAVKLALDELKTRLSQLASTIFSEQSGQKISVDELRYAGNRVTVESNVELSISFNDLISKAYFSQISLSATGYYKTPGIYWDKDKGKGNPFYYFAFGMAVSEVELDILTGYVRFLRTDILNDVGSTLNAEIDLGQVRGGFIQGLGWITTEDIKYDAKGNLLNASPDTYKIPVVDDIPLIFNTELLESIPNPGTIHGSKAVGEPPFMLALSVWMAIRDAVSATCNHQKEIMLGIPSTHEKILLCIEELKSKPPL
ncbi:MAG: xanthine dehydrogenase molybdopterin binding subunit [Bacteroidales bacterium]|nr:xanthine dehydrogenase molybdopterin binding subunit [Bacteroidales bacterium]